MHQTDTASLRHELRQKLSELEDILAPAFERSAVFPGYLQDYHRPCGNPRCRCAQGELHPGTRVLVPFKDGQGTIAVNEGAREEWQRKTEGYKRIRDALRAFRRWEGEVRALVDALERARRSTGDLPEKYRDRPLR